MNLVTVTISTYNSSSTVIETLESIFNQTWKDIELVIGDDASTDETMPKIKSWLDTNDRRKRFRDVKIIEVPENTGPTANAQRKLKVATGEWIKGIGADDTLMPDCISNYMEYISDTPEARIILSRINVYKDNFEHENFLHTIPGEVTPNSIVWHERSAASQYKMLLVSDRIHFTPSVFWHRETLLAVGGFDERFKFQEDYPIWLNLTRNGYKLHFMEKTTVNYRRHAKAINNTGKKYIVNPNYFRQEEFRKTCTYPHLPFDVRYNQRFKWYASQIFRWGWINRDKKFNKFLYLFLTTYVNPFRYLIWIKKRFSKNMRAIEFYG